MRKKIYESPKERQKAYRERKKKAGYRRVVIDVPEHVYAFIKRRPADLVSMFLEFAKEKGLFMDFDQISLSKNRETGERYLELKNKEGQCLKITDPEKITAIERVMRGKKFKQMRVYPDGVVQIIEKQIKDG